VASMVEGGRQRCSRGSQEAEVEEGAVGEVGDKATTRSEPEDEEAASSKAGDEAVACYRAGIKDDKRQRRVPRPGSRMTSGGGTTMCGATEERYRLAVSKNC
jgi:hypothetical protein